MSPSPRSTLNKSDIPIPLVQSLMCAVTCASDRVNPCCTRQIGCTIEQELARQFVSDLNYMRFQSTGAHRRHIFGRQKSDL